MNKMSIDSVKIKECLKFLQRYFVGVNDVAFVEYPRSLVYGSEEWLIYIFYSCLLDYGMRSKIYHSNLTRTYEIYPEIFVPKVVVNQYSNCSDRLLTILKENVHPRYPNVAVDKWIHLSKELARYESVRELVLSFKSFDELSCFIRKIKGYGQKTGGLLLRLISDSGICHFNDEIKAIPLDRHDIEICYLNGIIDKVKLNSLEVDELSHSLICGGKEIGLSPSVVDQYLWEIGNTFCNKKDCLKCPLGSVCKRKIK